MISDKELLRLAWDARENAAPSGNIKVGCAILNENNEVFQGWNVSGAWSKGIHAEVCAITQLVKSKKKGVKIAIVSKTKLFTPCGDCRDWLYRYCDVSSEIIIDNGSENIKKFILKDLLPYHPEV